MSFTPYFWEYNGKEMKMKKILSLLFVIILILSSTASCLDIKSPDDYYSDDVQTGEEKGTVTLKIDAEEIDQGLILSDTELPIYDGDTVYDVLIRASKKHELVIGKGGTSDFVYIKSINGIAEQAHGALSGWTYKVNGESPSVGCASYELLDGDTVEFIYTVEMKFE